MGLHHSTGCSLISGVTGDFHRPYETQKFLHSTIHRGTLPQSALRAASSLREGAGMGLYHSTGYSLKSGGAGGAVNGIRPDDGVPGSLSEGAAERSEAEGVYYGERNRSKISEFICAGV